MGKEEFTPDEIAFRKALGVIPGATNALGVRTECIIAFPNWTGDIDLLTLLNFSGSPRVINPFLDRARFEPARGYFGSPWGYIHTVAVNRSLLIFNIRFMSPFLRFNEEYKNLARDGKVIYGQEPLIGKIPFLEYIRSKTGLHLPKKTFYD